MKLLSTRSGKIGIFVLAITLFSAPLFASDDETETQPKPQYAISNTQIVTLYQGFITNKYEDSSKGVSMTDSGLMTGAFAQWVQHKSFQANLFGYWSPDVNYSRVYGLHANVDGYFLSTERVTMVAGLDFENINIDMDAGSHVSGLTEFKLKHNILFGMARSGASITVLQNTSLFAYIFPYVGITHQSVTGDISFVHPAGPPTFTKKEKFSIDDKQNYFSWGVNANLFAFRFIALGAKYLGRAEKNNYMHSVTASASVYVTRSLFVTYQFKYMQLGNGFDRYNIFGLGYVF